MVPRKEKHLSLELNDMNGTNHLTIMREKQA